MLKERNQTDSVEPWSEMFQAVSEMGPTISRY